MLSGEGNENGEKTAIGLTGKKKNFVRATHLFLYISFPLFCTTTTWNFQKLPIYTFCGGNFLLVLVHSFFFTAAHFHIGGRYRFSLFYHHYKIFTFFFQQKLSPLFFISRCSSLSLFLSLWALLACRPLSLFLCLSLSLYSKLLDMTINLSLILKITRIQKAFLLSVLIFIDSLVSASQRRGWLCDFPPK